MYMKNPHFPWIIQGRHTRPDALAVSIVMMAEAWALLISGNDPGALLDDRGPMGLTFGVVSLIAFFLLWVGYWAQNERAMKNGLLIAAVVMGARTGLILTSIGMHQSAAFSVGWVIVAGGAYLLEYTDVGAGFRGWGRGDRE